MRRANSGTVIVEPTAMVHVERSDIARVQNAVRLLARDELGRARMRSGMRVRDDDQLRRRDRRSLCAEPHAVTIPPSP
jgi:hypothetical protein